MISCFSTGLATARYLLGIEAVAVGTADLLASLKPYENSNRVPLVLAEALFADRMDFEACPDETEDPTPGWTCSGWSTPSPTACSRRCCRSLRRRHAAVPEP